MPGFEPIVGSQPHTLILGTMPSVRSLHDFQYYAHPRNSFWPIMSAVFLFDKNSSYSNRCDYMIDNQIAVWDVLYDCERPGSLDSSIVKESEVVNDFIGFFKAYPSVTKVIFNGAAAEKIFKRYNKQIMQTAGERIKWYRCPSTSPAHASMTFEQKKQAWLTVLKYDHS